MTLIGNHQHAAMVSKEPSSPLAVGQKMEVRVLGSTRHGVSILIGQEQFRLDVPSELADAETLTLRGTASSSPSGNRAQIVARDDRPLAKPVIVDLVSKPQPSPPMASAVVQKSQIEVVAQPIGHDGRSTGPRIALLLQAQAPATAATIKAISEPASSAASTRAPSSDDSPQTPSVTGQQERVSSSIGFVPGTRSGLDTRPSDGSLKPLLTNDALPREGASKPASAQPVAMQPNGTKPSTSDLLRSEHPSAPQKGAATSVTSVDSRVPADGKPQALGGIAASAASTYRSGWGHGSVPVSSVSPPLARSEGTSVAPLGDRWVAATVVERTSAGKVILEAAGQRMRIEQPVDLPLETTLSVTFAAIGSASAGPIDSAAPVNPTSALTELIELLDNIDRAGRQVADDDGLAPPRQLPLPDKQLAARFLGLLAASGQQPSGSAEASLPEQRGTAAVQSDRVHALVRDLASMASEPLAEGWKSLALPVGPDPAQAVCFYFRDHALDPDPDSDATDEDAETVNAQRAIFDVSFSRLGRCQVDALCQEQRFDLMIRSERSLPHEDRQDIAALLNSACEIAGVRGEIGFQVGSFFEPARSSSTKRDLRM